MKKVFGRKRRQPPKEAYLGIYLYSMISKEIDSLRAEFFDNAQIQFMVFDKDLNIIDVNQTLLDLYHLSREQLVGKHLLEVAPGSIGKGLYDKYKEVLRTGNPTMIEEIISDPRYGSLCNRIKAFKVGDGLGAAAVDITAFKNTLESLEALVLSSSHDLKSPLSNIVGLATLASKEEGNEKINEYLQIIKEQAQKMANCIERLTDTIKLQKSEIETQKINFEALLREIKMSFAYVPGFTDLKFSLNIIAEREFNNDKNILTSILQNLIDNGVKYRRENFKEAFLNITIADDITGIKIIVSDNGTGIPGSLQKNVFKMFFRASDKTGGSGLGLYTVRQAVLKLNGHITFHSEENRGTTFTIYLPDNKFSQKALSLVESKARI